MAKKAPVVVLEGAWWSGHEFPLVLPYFHALSISHREIDVAYRTIRGVRDIAYYVNKIPTHAGALLYFACHGRDTYLMPAGHKSAVSPAELCVALGNAKPGAIAFVHFGCCEMIDPRARRETHQGILDATGAKWSSGYTTSVDWLPSMFLDLALVTEVFAPSHTVKDPRRTSLRKRATQFVATYEQLARALGFSALSEVAGGAALFPERLHA
jgi:hypothetical protein